MIFGAAFRLLMSFLVSGRGLWTAGASSGKELVTVLIWVTIISEVSLMKLVTAGSVTSEVTVCVVMSVKVRVAVDAGSVKILVVVLKPQPPGGHAIVFAVLVIVFIVLTVFVVGPAQGHNEWQKF